MTTFNEMPDGNEISLLIEAKLGLKSPLFHLVSIRKSSYTNYNSPQLMFITIFNSNRQQWGKLIKILFEVNYNDGFTKVEMIQQVYKSIHSLTLKIHVTTIHYLN